MQKQDDGVAQARALVRAESVQKRQALQRLLPNAGPGPRARRCVGATSAATVPSLLRSAVHRAQFGLVGRFELDALDPREALG